MILNRLSLSQQLSLVFAALLLACCGASVWLQVRANGQHEQEVTQRLSLGLAAHIAGNAELMQASGLNAPAVKDLFGKLMAVNPSVEVYLLSTDGRIQAQDAPEGHLKRDHVNLAPIRMLLGGGALPIFGDDPRSSSGEQKVFSVAPLRLDGRDSGYVYVVLLGENRDTLAAGLRVDSIKRSMLWSMGLVTLLGLLAGLAAFRLITRPLRRLTSAVRQFEANGLVALDSAAPALAKAAGGGGEIATLGQAFGRMTQRIAEQWRELTLQDQQRRELFANISHDLRTPLTSLHGYLETLLIKVDTLGPTDRRHYLEIALGQSSKVGQLAQELFELARLEYGVVKPDMESFALADLVQDVFQKFELSAEARGQHLVPDIADGLPVVTADLGMIERVLTNLLDNAIRHTPEGGEIVVQLSAENGGVRVEVSDTGAGIPDTLQKALFVRPVFSWTGGRAGGLGLVIVKRILELHGSDIRLLKREDRGAVFSFDLN